MRRWSALLVVFAALLLPATPARAAHDEHRVVWDGAGHHGIVLRSALADGSGEVLLHRQPRGFSMGVALDAGGRRVALATAEPRRRPPRVLVLATTGTGRAHDVLAGDDPFYAVGAVGWSPNGERLVLEAFRTHGGRNDRELWTVGRDGTGLRRLRTVGEVTDDGFLPVGSGVPWTRRGVFYAAADGLHRFARGRDHAVLRGVRSVVSSGDGRWLFVERYGPGPRALWRLHPDGTGLEELFTLDQPDGSYLGSSRPSRDGTELLTQVLTEGQVRVVRHPVERAPLPSDPSLGFLDEALELEWR
ncbi:hypothetical protein G5V58_16075 [Nocardioides anomalus]|uniref:WD40 repeat domain-containing protein n=1 Tax=Nocardioides anomalus TaxID=2712223 RepID=A0A6G6WFV3_9ACTN|nr:hypothetical protein [Nocardioides anomalus]QIG44089.1 hypothetical protein G5V58_16075 [Nocardioides anomalus]